MPALFGDSQSLIQALGLVGDRRFDESHVSKLVDGFVEISAVAPEAQVLGKRRSAFRLAGDVSQDPRLGEVTMRLVMSMQNRSLRMDRQFHHEITSVSLPEQVLHVEGELTAHGMPSEDHRQQKTDQPSASEGQSVDGTTSSWRCTANAAYSIMHPVWCIFICLSIPQVIEV